MRQEPQSVNSDSPLINGGRRITVFLRGRGTRLNVAKFVFYLLIPAIKRLFVNYLETVKTVKKEGFIFRYPPIKIGG